MEALLAGYDVGEGLLDGRRCRGCRDGGDGGENGDEDRGVGFHGGFRLVYFQGS